MVVVNVHHSFIVRGHLSSCFILNLLTENDGDVIEVVSARNKAVSGSDDEPGDLVTSDPHQTDLISPVVDERSGTAGAGPGGGVVQPDEGRPGELSYLRIFPSDDRLLRKVKSFPQLFSRICLL